MKEIDIYQGLKQCDLLANFLFLLVEGLGGLVQSVVERYLYAGFRLGSPQVEVSYLQYADDTLLIEAAIISNLWALKSVLGVLNWSLVLQ